MVMFNALGVPLEASTGVSRLCRLSRESYDVGKRSQTTCHQVLTKSMRIRRTRSCIDSQLEQEDIQVVSELWNVHSLT